MRTNQETGIKESVKTALALGSGAPANDNFPSLPGGSPPKTNITKGRQREYKAKPKQLTKFGETYDRKPKQKRKVIVETHKDEAEGEADKDDNNFDDLIKESVQEALHDKVVNEKPAREFHYVDDTEQYTGTVNSKKRNRNKKKNKGNGFIDNDFPTLPMNEQPVKRPITAQPPPNASKKGKKNNRANKVVTGAMETKKNDKPVSYVETEENPFQMKAQKANRVKKEKAKPRMDKMFNDFPGLGGKNSDPPLPASSTRGTILRETKDDDDEYNQSLQKKFGIVITQNKSKKNKKRR
jgi:hypothetical protein